MHINYSSIEAHVDFIHNLSFFNQSCMAIGGFCSRERR